MVLKATPWRLTFPQGLAVASIVVAAAAIMLSRGAVGAAPSEGGWAVAGLNHAFLDVAVLYLANLRLEEWRRGRAAAGS